MTAADPIELTGGRWVQRGGIRVWVEDETRIEPIDFGPYFVVSGVLCECGCLLRDERELCPNCVVGWIREAEIRGIRLAWERANRTEKKREAA